MLPPIPDPKIITPSIGRKVWYRPFGHNRTELQVWDDAQACDAMVIYVWNDRMVNLQVVGPSGIVRAYTSVPFLQADDAVPNIQHGGYAQWMPFQVGQAKAAAKTANEVQAAAAAISQTAAAGPIVLLPEFDEQEARAAIATLIRLGYEWNGGVLWRPPLPKQVTVGLSFGKALEALKRGCQVARSGWNGKGMWLELQCPDEHSKMTLPYIFLNYPDDAQKTPGARVPWLASQTDMLANDWSMAE